MKRHARNIIFTVLALAAIAVLALMLKDSSKAPGTKVYDALASTETKFAHMARWIPPSSEFDVTIDVSKALSNHQLRMMLINIVTSQGGVAAELVGALLHHEGAIGLLTVAGTLGEVGSRPHIVVLAQGAFDQDALLPVVRRAMTEGRAGLSSEDLGWNTLYSESNARHPFAFLILDKAHMAVGERDALMAFFQHKPPPPEALNTVPDEVLFGHLTIGPRLQKLVPGMQGLPKNVIFASADGKTLAAVLRCDSTATATKLSLFLEGIKALLLLQQENNPAFTEILNGISVGIASNDVNVTTDLAPLLKLWAAPSSGEERNELSPAHEDEPPVGELEVRDDGKPQE